MPRRPAKAGECIHFRMQGVNSEVSGQSVINNTEILGISLNRYFFKLNIKSFPNQLQH